MSNPILSRACLPCALLLAACGSDAAGAGPDPDAVGVSDAGEDAADTQDAVAPDAGEDVIQIDLGNPGDDASVDVAPDTEDAGPVEDTTPPPFADPALAGPFETRRVEETVETSVQDVRLGIHLPTDAGAGPFPVVMVNHGFQMRAASYESYAERLASHGFVAATVAVEDTLLRSRSHAELRDIQEELNDWVVTAAAEAGSRVFGVADPELLGLAGHSRGGKQSIHAAVTDDRVDAVFGIDPVDAEPPIPNGDNPSVTPELMDELAIPSGYIGSTLGGTPADFGPACAPTDNNYERYFENSPSPSYAWLPANSGHNDYVDGCDALCEFACARGDDPAANIAFAQTTMVAFFKVHLVGDDRYSAWLDGDEVPENVEVQTR